MATNVLENIIYPLITASTIISLTILSTGADFDRTAVLFIWFMIASQLIPWFTFLSYASNKNSFTSISQRISLFIAWFIVYVIGGNIVIYLSPHVESGNIWNPKHILQLWISAMTVNHSIRILAILVGDDWFHIKNITTPCQAMFAFNASAVIAYKDKSTNGWIGWIKAIYDICVHLAIDLILLKCGAYLYHIPQYKSYIDQHLVLYYELSAIYCAISIDFATNRMSWINVFVYGDSIDIKYGQQFPVLSTSPRDFWRRQTVYQREALKLGIFKPVIKSTQSYWLAVIMVFFGNYIVHITMTWEMTFSYFGFYEWSVIFAILVLSVGTQLYVEKVFLKTYKMEYVKDNWLYKMYWFVVLHMTMATIVYIGVPKLIPAGLECSFWWLDHYW